MDNTQIPWKPLLQFLGQLLAGLGQTGEQQEWVPYGHHLHCRVGFFSPLKSMLQSWLLSQHGCITGIPELLAGSGGRRGLPGSLSTRCNFTTRLEVESSLTN